MNAILATIILFTVSFADLRAAEYVDGRIKLVIDEKNARFSLYYMTDVEKRVFEPLFWDKDKRTSFISAFINDKEYKMGSNSEFKTIMRGEKNKPVMAFEAEFLSVTAAFSFIRTASSGVSNGVRIDIGIESWSPKKIYAGARLLIDTFLGEKNAPSFRTDLRPIESETVIDKTSPDQYWVSREDKYGLMGSVFVEGTEGPDFLHFANWKRLNGSRFKVDYVPGRNFNATRFSIKDAAVCYFLDVKPMERWERRVMTVLLAAEDNYGFGSDKILDGGFAGNVAESAGEVWNGGGVNAGGGNYPPPAGIYSNTAQAAPSATYYGAPLEQPDRAEKTVKRRGLLLPLGAMRIDVLTLRELMYKVDEYIYSGNMPAEEEIKAMELTIAKLKARYGSVFNTF
jgi:hypothetical protein